LGFVCETDIDCLVGTCRSDDPGHPELALKLCTISCESDADCSKFNSDQGAFVCSAGPENRHCVTPSAYTGALCETTADCGHRDKGTICARQQVVDPKGTCLYPCDFKTPCAARDGVGHTCVPLVGDDNNKTGVCFPGVFGLPCFDDSQCAVPDLKCAGVDLSNAQNPKPGLCTHLCASEADCSGDVWTAGQAYCGAPSLPVCLPLMDDGADCEADRQCASKVCAMPPGSGMTKTCGGKVKS
jgi:hypothetical protein